MTFVFLAATIFGLDGIRTTYVLVSVIASFGANCGLGLVQAILTSKVRKELAARRNAMRPSGGRRPAREESDESESNLAPRHSDRRFRTGLETSDEPTASAMTSDSTRAKDKRAESSAIPSNMSQLLYDVLFGDSESEEELEPRGSSLWFDAQSQRSGDLYHRKSNMSSKSEYKDLLRRGGSSQPGGGHGGYGSGGRWVHSSDSGTTGTKFGGNTQALRRAARQQAGHQAGQGGNRAKSGSAISAASSGTALDRKGSTGV